MATSTNPAPVYGQAQADKAKTKAANAAGRAATAAAKLKASTKLNVGRARDRRRSHTQGKAMRNVTPQANVATVSPMLSPWMIIAGVGVVGLGVYYLSNHHG